MKLPNKYGSICKLSGARRKPFMVRVTVGWDYDEDSDKISQDRKILGYYRTRKEATEALASFNANPYDLSKANITLNDVFCEWYKEHERNIKDSSKRTITSAWNYCCQLHDIPIREIRVRNIKSAVENAYAIKDKQKVSASPNIKGRVKSLLNQIFDYAVQLEYVDKNYARQYEMSESIVADRTANTNGHIAFTDDEIELLWKAVGTIQYADWVIIQCYTGLRPQELATMQVENVDIVNGVMTGGMKTKAGTNRTIPIHNRILPLVKKNLNDSIRNSSNTLLSFSPSRGDDCSLTYDKYSKRFMKALEAVGITGHRPHDARKTFVTLAKRYNVDEYAIKRIVGHSIEDITERIYTERNVEWLKQEINKIP